MLNDDATCTTAARTCDVTRDTQQCNRNNPASVTIIVITVTITAMRSGAVAQRTVCIERSASMHEIGSRRVSATGSSCSKGRAASAMPMPMCHTIKRARTFGTGNNG